MTTFCVKVLRRRTQLLQVPSLTLIPLTPCLLAACPLPPPHLAKYFVTDYLQLHAKELKDILTEAIHE